jgi:hypothetical protein
MFRLSQLMVRGRGESYFRKAEVDPDGHQNAGNGRLASNQSLSRQSRHEEDSDFGANRLFRPHEPTDCLERGCDGYIVKPFSLRDLQRKVRELIDNAQKKYRRKK